MVVDIDVASTTDVLQRVLAGRAQLAIVGTEPADERFVVRSPAWLLGGSAAELTPQAASSS